MRIERLSARRGLVQTARHAGTWRHGPICVRFPPGSGIQARAWSRQVALWTPLRCLRIFDLRSERMKPVRRGRGLDGRGNPGRRARAADDEAPGGVLLRPARSSFGIAARPACRSAGKPEGGRTGGSPLYLRRRPLVPPPAWGRVPGQEKAFVGSVNLRQFPSWHVARAGRFAPGIGRPLAIFVSIIRRSFAQFTCANP